MAVTDNELAPSHLTTEIGSDGRRRVVVRINVGVVTPLNAADAALVARGARTALA